MLHTLRTLSLGLLTATALSSAAQGHTIHVAGHANPCNPAIAGSTVTIWSFGTVSGVATSATAALNANCYYSLEMTVADTAGWVAVEGSCGNGMAAIDTVFYSLTPPFTTDVILDLNCGAAPACQACFTVDQTAPFTAVFSSCSSGGSGTYSYIWDFSGPGGGAVSGDGITRTFPGPGQYVACLNLTDSEGCTSSVCHQVYVDEEGNISFDPPTGCEACISITQAMNGNNAVPFQADFTNCSTGAPIMQHLWWLPNGLNSDEQDQTFTFQGPGVYGVCLDITDGMGCESSVCDTVVIGQDGLIITSEPWNDCLGVPFGPDVPGSPCDNPMLGEGTWNANCECEVDEPTDCEAGFWVIQAYENGDSTGTPIPNTLWIWNLSNGGSGFYQYFWDFGDGTSSTAAFPTHTYADNGPYILCLTISDSEGCTDTHCDSVSVNEDGFLNGLIVEGHGTSHNGQPRSGFTINVVDPLHMGAPDALGTQLTAFPNPVMDRLTVTFMHKGGTRVTADVIDANGRRVLNQPLRAGTGVNRIDLDLGELPGGLYMLRLDTGSGVSTLRFVKGR